MDGTVTILRCDTATEGSKIQIEIATVGENIQLGLFFKFDPAVQRKERTGGDGDCSINQNEENTDALADKDNYKVLLDNKPDSGNNPREEAQDRVYRFTHEFSGEGQYVVVFDNTFSLINDKEVHYKVTYFYN